MCKFSALTERLAMWKEGKIELLWKDNCIIQKKLLNSPKRPASDISRVVTKLMFEGKVGAAMKFLDKTAENGVLQPTPQVIAKLQKLHPEQADILPDTLYQGPLPNEAYNAHFTGADLGLVNLVISQGQVSYYTVIFRL